MCSSDLITSQFLIVERRCAIITDATDGTLTVGMKSPGTGCGRDWTGFAGIHLVYLGTLEEAEAQLDAVLEGQIARANTLIDYEFRTDKYYSEYPNFSQALKEENAGETFRLIDELMNAGKDPQAFIRDLGAHLRTLLLQKRQVLSLAESCTGGGAAARLVNVPSASWVLDGSFVTYAEEAKARLAGVRPETIRKYGVVSEPVAEEMAEGCARAMQSEVGVGITGVAGPEGGADMTPVGMVCFGFRLPDRTITATRHFGNIGRNQVREECIRFVFDTLAEELDA